MTFAAAHDLPTGHGMTMSVPDDRRLRALAAARAATEALTERGVTALVTGSLARGGFTETSDIDLLITDCPRSQKYAIEGVVEDCLSGFAFDVIYLEELSDRLRLSVLDRASDVRALG